MPAISPLRRVAEGMRRCDAWQKDANNDAGNDYYRGTVRLSGGVGEGGKLLADSDWTHFPSDASNVPNEEIRVSTIYGSIDLRVFVLRECAWISTSSRRLAMD